MLETALDGGSVSIFENQKQIDWLKGSGKLSKSEDILLVIEDLLKRNSIKKSEIKFITVSDGPGSLTGIRIGQSIAKGLADSLGVGILKISILEALLKQCTLTDRVGVALSTEKTGVFYREYFLQRGFQARALGKLDNLKLADFIEKISRQEGEEISYVFSEKLEAALRGSEFGVEILEKVKYCSVPGKLANIVGRSAADLMPTVL